MRFRIPHLPGKPVFVLSFLLLVAASADAQPGDLPWDPDPDCNCIVTTGIAAVTCGTINSIPANMQFTFGLMDLNGALPAAGRVDVTGQQDMYKIDSWLIDSIGNVFGITFDNGGNIYITASSNYSSDFFGNPSVIRYGEIGGGVDDLGAAGTIYKLACTSGQPTVFAQLPQQSYNFTHTTCEGLQMIDRTSGPGLGNITYSVPTSHFYVSNFEDGRIYRLDTLGNILDSYDPLGYDNGQPGPPQLEGIAYGLALDPDNERLFFGTIGDDTTPSMPSIYSIDLNPDGSFVGAVDNTTMPAGATWDNFVGAEQMHYALDFFNGFFYVHFISDLEFTPAGELLIGKRLGCSSTLQSSYNHDGQAILIDDNGSGIYNQYVGNIYTSDGAFSDENAYGGVDYFDNPMGGLEFVFSSADILSEQGPHGIVTIEAYSFGTSFNPAAPAGAIAYIPSSFADLKGIGGDVQVFKSCNVEQSCPLEVAVTDLTICSGEPFDLTYVAQGGNAEVEAVWTDAAGDPVDPSGLTLTNMNCTPMTVPFYLTAGCVIDSSTVLVDTLTVTVYTDDLSPFVTIIEDPCFLDVQLDPDCAGDLELIGEIPVINPGDSGTVVLQLVQTSFPECNPLQIELNYNCACALTGFNAITEECEDGLFYVTIDLEPTNSSDIFQVIDQDGFNYGTWDYDQLPLTFGPFEGDATTEYSLTALDAQLAGCASTVTFGPVYCDMIFQTAVENPICTEGVGTLTITNIVGGLAPYLYSVDGGATFSTEPVFTDLPPGDYEVVVQDATGNEVETIEVVFEPAPVIINLEPEIELGLGDSYQLNVQTNLPPGDIGTIQWVPETGLSCTDCLNPVASPVEDVTYTVFITDLNGCPAEATVTFRVDPFASIYVPNIFTPDEDGTNDLFMIYARDGTVSEIRSFLIFSRWGELVFEGYNFMPNDPAYGWNGDFRGEPMNPAVFAWYAIVEFVDGRVQLLKGDVTLAR